MIQPATRCLDGFLPRLELLDPLFLALALACTRKTQCPNYPGQCQSLSHQGDEHHDESEHQYPVAVGKWRAIRNSEGYRKRRS